jgi:hypothetical protein
MRLPLMFGSEANCLPQVMADELAAVILTPEDTPLAM